MCSDNTASSKGNFSPDSPRDSESIILNAIISPPESIKNSDDSEKSSIFNTKDFIFDKLKAENLINENLQFKRCYYTFDSNEGNINYSIESNIKISINLLEKCVQITTL